MLHDLFWGQLTHRQVLELEAMFGEYDKKVFFGTCGTSNTAYMNVPLDFDPSLEPVADCNNLVAEPKTKEIKVEPLIELPDFIAKKLKYRVYSKTPLKAEDKAFIGYLKGIKSMMTESEFEAIHFQPIDRIDPIPKQWIASSSAFNMVIPHKELGEVMIYSSNPKELAPEDSIKNRAN